MSYFNNKSLFFLLMLVTCLGNTVLHAQNDQLPSRIYEIRFGIIEPPVVAQKDITTRAETSNQQQGKVALECSSLAWDNGSLLITSDRHRHLIFSCPVDLEKMEIGTPEPWIIVHNEQYLLNDLESMALLIKGKNTYLYAMCSLSNAPDAQPLPQRRQMLMCSLKSTSALQFDNSRVFSVETIRMQLEKCFEKIKVKPYYAFDAAYIGEDKNTYRWGNVEGITFTPDNKYILCGMRNPIYAGDAILFVVDGIDNILSSTHPETLKLIDFFLLNLGNRGISDLTWDPLTNGYLITAAKSNGPQLDPDSPYPPNNLDSALFWWSGHKQDEPVWIAGIPDMTIEAVCRLGNSPYIALGSDEGDISEGRAARQSIITIIYFNGIHKQSE